jgi:hypothetical protein
MTKKQKVKALSELVESMNNESSSVSVYTEWSRVPKAGMTLEGLFRSQIFRLIASGAVKSVSIKHPGARKTGQRLVNLPSLRSWINSQCAEGKNER